MGYCLEAQRFLEDINERLFDSLKTEGIALPRFNVHVKPISDFETDLRSYHRQFVKSNAGRVSSVNAEDTFVSKIQEMYEDALVIAAPLAGQEGTLYVRELPSGKARNVVLMHEDGHLIQTALNWQNYISLGDFAKTPETFAASNIQKEGFGTWFSYAFQKAGGYDISCIGTLTLHDQPEYLQGFEFFNYVGNRFGPKQVFDTVRFGHTIPLDTILNPSKFNPEELTRTLSRAYLDTGDDSHLRAIKHLYKQNFMGYLEKHGFFVTPFDKIEGGFDMHSTGFVIEGNIEGKPIYIGFPFVKYAFESSSHEIGEPFTADFEDNYVRKITDPLVLKTMSDCGYNSVFLGDALKNTPRKDPGMPHRIFIPHAYIRKTSVEQISKDIKLMQ